MIAESSQVLPGRQVWGHMVPHGLPDYREQPGRNDYGSTYPLDLVPGGPHDAPRPGSGMSRAQQAGLTGMQILQFEGVNAGSDFVVDWMTQADPTWVDADVNNDFSIAPCLQLDSPAGLTRMAREYVEVARGRPSAAQVNGRYVVYVYGSRSLSAQQWRQARAELDASGLPVFLVGDLQTDASQTGHRIESTRLDGYAEHFDAVWNFEDSTHRIWPGLLAYLAERRLPYAGGVMPGYNRETSRRGGFVDADGTALFRRQWEAALVSGAPWGNVVAWNDVVEHTDIKASSDWNVTRADINAFYAAALRGLPAPKPRAELYVVTTPSFRRAGEPVGAEALVLNGGNEDVHVHVRLVDGDGAPVGDETRESVAVGRAGAAVTPERLDKRLPAGRFVRAEAWTTDDTGRELQRVSSAPVLIYDTHEKARTPMQRTHYYSVPAASALPGEVTLRLDGSPTLRPGDARAAVTAPSGVQVRFAEVLSNTRQVDLGFGVGAFEVSVPMAPRSIVGGQRVSADAAGFYVGRVIDEQERVGYSDPVYVHDPRD